MLSKSKLATIVHCTLEEFCTLWHLWRKIRSKLEKYRWENLFVPFQSHLRSDCHIDRLQILIGKNVSHDTLARKSRKMQFVPFPSPRSWYQRDGMLLSNETWGPDQVCLKHLRAAMHHCSVETHPNLWAAIQCTVKFSEMQWNLSNGCTAVQCSWRSAVIRAVCSGGQRWLCKCIGSTQSCDLWDRPLCLFLPLMCCCTSFPDKPDGK